MNLYETPTYREYVRAWLESGDPGARRGAVRRLAGTLRVHSTYVSQVTKGKADFNVDQAMRFCLHLKMPPEDTEYFLDLLQRDRAATREARDHFQARIDRRLAEQLDMKKRWRIADTLTSEQESRYYATWIPPALHLHCQLPGVHTTESIAAGFGLDHELVARTLQDLAALGLVEEKNRAWRSLRDSVHLGKDSPNYVRSHLNWRLKTVSDASASGAMPGTHYSSVISMSEETAREIERLILKHLEETRAAVLPSPPERLFVYCLDFYPLLRRSAPPAKS